MAPWADHLRDLGRSLAGCCRGLIRRKARLSKSERPVHHAGSQREEAGAARKAQSPQGEWRLETPRRGLSAVSWESRQSVSEGCCSFLKSG